MEKAAALGTEHLMDVTARTKQGLADLEIRHAKRDPHVRSLLHLMLYRLFRPRGRSLLQRNKSQYIPQSLFQWFGSELI